MCGGRSTVAKAAGSRATEHQHAANCAREFEIYEPNQLALHTRQPPPAAWTHNAPGRPCPLFDLSKVTLLLLRGKPAHEKQPVHITTQGGRS